VTTTQILVNLTGLSGALLLLYPAVHVARYALKAARLAELRHRFEEPLRTELDRTQQQLSAIRDNWGRGKTYAFIAGTTLTVLSYALPFALWLL
jgi:hypothetical protein